MNIGIVGLGFVGNAIKRSFEIKNINVICYDKYKNGGIGKINDTINCHILFLCLPTILKNNDFDLSNLNEVLLYYNKIKFTGLIVIKSTITPTTTFYFKKKYKYLKLLHNPEFLSARTAFKDFHNQKHIVIGGDYINSKILYNFYNKYYTGCLISLMTTNESESLKLCANSFYAVKIQFFNEIYDMCHKIENCDFETVKNGILKNGWVNNQHTSVPGSDGKLSFGGACFPKDTQALLSFLKKKNSKCKILKATVEENIEMRN